MDILELMTKEKKLLENSEIFAPKVDFWGEIARRNLNFSEICLGKIEIFGPGYHEPQISNQIDATAFRQMIQNLEEEQRCCQSSYLDNER